MTEHLCDLPAHEQVRRIKGEEISAVELLKSTLERIDAVEGRQATTEPYTQNPTDLEKVHAFITVTRERAHAQAESVDQKITAGEDPGPLAGVSLAVKDIFCVKDTPSTAGSKILENFISPYSATPVKHLEEAGAVVVGKVNLDEFTFGSSNESSAFLPPVGNPWDPAYVPGGSSGGSTAAVAAGEAAISLGTDTAGSIRQPAAFCGVVGMKPTYGRVSRYGLIAFASSLDCPGPVARNVTDTALMMNVIAGSLQQGASSVQDRLSSYLTCVAVLRWNTSDCQFRGDFSVDRGPTGVAFDGERVWVANSTDGTVTAVRVADNLVASPVQVGIEPVALAFDGRNSIWVVNHGSNTVTVLHTQSAKVMATYSVGNGPGGIAFDGQNMWITNDDSQAMNTLMLVSRS